MEHISLFFPYFFSDTQSGFFAHKFTPCSHYSQLSSLLFRTTNQGELREALFALELGIRRFLAKVFFQKKQVKTENRFSGYIALFLCFIPEIFENWALINLAWKARGGKQGFTKIKTLTFVLISLSMEKASVKAKALEARQQEAVK